MTPICPPYIREMRMVNKGAREMTTKVLVQLESLDGTYTKNLIANTVRGLLKGTGIVDWNQEKQNFKHLQVINFPRLPENPRLILMIGTDNNALFFPSQCVEDPKDQDGPTAFKTRLGWTATGSSESELKNKATLMSLMQHS